MPVTTLEAMRQAARPIRQPKPELVAMFCMRCERPFKSTRMQRECFNCTKAALKAFGSPHPQMEAAGA